MNSKTKSQLKIELVKTERSRKFAWKSYFTVEESYRLFVSSVLENGHLTKAQRRILKELYLNQEDNHKTCIICSDVISDSLVISKCGHIHHKECLINWTNINNCCPICRDVITKLIDL